MNGFNDFSDGLYILGKFKGIKVLLHLFMLDK